MDDATLRAHLRRFGFSEKEVDTYLTLLEHGEAKASTIATIAGVSKRYVYSVSEALADRGFVTVDDHVVPTMIRAIPPEDVVSQLVTDAEAIQPALEARHTHTEPEADQFEVVKSRVTVLKRIRSLIAEAEDELTLSVPVSQLAELAGDLRAARERDVLVVLLVTETTEPPAEIDGLASVARMWREPMPAMVAADRRLGLVAPAEMLRSAHSETQAVVFAHPQLGPVISGSFFGNYWPVGTEISVAEPALLPVTETDFWTVIFQATLWLRSETALTAHIVGRWTESSEPADLTCRVVDVTQGLVEPTNNQFPVEHSLTIDCDGSHHTVGGEGAFIEEIEATQVTLFAEQSE